jgi:magnesium-transporting ATPase (P-type)
MTYKGDPIAEKLDRVAGFSGVPQLARKIGDGRPPRSSVLPWLMLAAAVAGLGVQIAVSGMLGFWIVWTAWIATSTIFQLLGPLGQPRKLDEREAGVFRQSHFTGMAWAFGVAVLGSLAIAIGKAGAPIGLWDIWAPQGPTDWLTVTLFLLAIEVNVAALAARAATPEPLDDEE